MKTILGLVAMAALGYAGDSGREDALRKLETMKITVDFQDVKLAEAMDYLRDVTGLNLVILPRAAEKGGDLKIRLKVRELSVKSTLKLMLSGKGLAMTWRAGSLVVLPQEDLLDNVVLEMYDIRDKIMKLQDFPGPRMELVTPKTGSTQTAGIIVSLEEPPHLIEPEFLVQLVKDNTGGRSWDSPNVSINQANGMLLISQSPSVHAEIKGLLTRLGQSR
jgi:hypothetical protein